jgi:glycerophosphoryl diester phosphodiesterase
MFLKIGHRGACGYEPENTLRSFTKALELGVDMVEFDVHLSRSGELVVIHDETIDRTTNGKGLVSDKTLKELKTYNAGKEEKIPSLLEVLDLVDKRCAVNIELKGKNTEELVSSTILEYINTKGWKYSDFIISSFNFDALKKIRNLLDKEAQIGLLVENLPANLPAMLSDIKAYCLNPENTLITKEFVNEMHRSDVKVFAWVVNEPAVIKKLKGYGIDGIFSDFPDRISL